MHTILLGVAMTPTTEEDPLVEYLLAANLEILNRGDESTFVTFRC